MSVVKVFLEHPKAQQPTRSYGTSACYNVTCVSSKIIYPGTAEMIDLGIRLFIPEGYYVKFWGRSGLAIKHDVVPFPGVLDAGYSGLLNCKVYNNGKEPYQVNCGDAIVQLEICKMTDLNEDMDIVDKEQYEAYAATSKRNENGIGSTGK